LSFRDNAVPKRLFFNLIPRCLKDLDFHGLPIQGALQLADPLISCLELRDRNHVLIGSYRDSGTAANTSLPVLKERRLYAQLSVQLSGRDLTARDTTNCFLLEELTNSALNSRRPSEPFWCFSMV
jgi:hypothetical protein